MVANDNKVFFKFNRSIEQFDFMINDDSLELVLRVLVCTIIVHISY
jgi:hypothetical protein